MIRGTLSKANFEDLVHGRSTTITAYDGTLGRDVPVELLLNDIGFDAMASAVFDASNSGVSC